VLAPERVIIPGVAFIANPEPPEIIPENVADNGLRVKVLIPADVKV
jgi:hypothetical protein